jgi:hypothetical protein
MAVNVPIISEWRDKGLKTASRDIDGFSKKAKRQFEGLASAGRKIALGFAAAATGAAAFAKSAVDAASDFDESASKLGVIIGGASDAVIDFAKNASALGISANEAADAAGKFAIFGKAAGLSGDQLAQFSTEFITLSADLASFNNSSPQEAIDAIGAALRGESEPLRRFGVLLDDATMRQAALELGIYDGNGALNAQQKILAAQKLIYAQTGDAQGDFERTSGGLANQQRILAARLSNLRMEIGMKLLPIFTKFAGFLANRLYPAVERFTRFAWRRLTDAFQTARPFLERIVSLFQDHIRPAIERVVKFMQDNENVVKAFLGVLAGAAALAALAALAGALGALVTPLGLIVAAAAAVAGAFVYMYENVEWFRNAVDTIGRWFRDKFPVYFREAVDKIRELWDKLWPGLLAMGQWFQNTWLNEDSKWRQGLEVAWAKTWNGVERFVGGVFDNIILLLNSFSSVFAGLWNVFLGAITGDWSRTWTGIQQIATGGFGSLKFGFGVLSLPIKVLWAMFGEELKLVWGLVWGFITEQAGKGWAILKQAWSAGTGFIADLWDRTIGRIISAVGNLVGSIATAKQEISSLANAAIPGPIKAIGGVIGGIAGGIKKVIPFADGGLVTGPTLGLVGEAGPELVIPLDKIGSMGGGTINVYVQGSVITERDLIEQIRVGLIRSQRSGRPLVA